METRFTRENIYSCQSIIELNIYIENSKINRKKIKRNINNKCHHQFMDINVNDDGDETAQQTVDDDELDKIKKKNLNIL